MLGWRYWLWVRDSWRFWLKVVEGKAEERQCKTSQSPEMMRGSASRHAPGWRLPAASPLSEKPKQESQPWEELFKNNNHHNNGVAQIFWLPWFLGTVVFAAFQIPNIDVANFTWRKKKSDGIFSVVFFFFFLKLGILNLQFWGGSLVCLWGICVCVCTKMTLSKASGELLGLCLMMLE